jgi:Tfp pilus assembly protein PilN
MLLTLAAVVLAACALRLCKTGGEVVSHLDRLTSEVAEMKAAAERAAGRIAEIAQLLRDRAGDAAAIESLADELDTAGNALHAAVDASSEPAPEPPAEPV